MITRRDWLAGLAAGVAGTTLVHRGLAQDPPGQSNMGPMDQGAARPVRLPPRPGATPSMTPDERDQLERRIRCQCGCTLDVYTCRTTDFSCSVSPAMHRDIMALVEGGYDAREIMDAFVGVYGERARMAPTTKGFNLVGWVAPFAALAAGAAFVSAVLREWKRRSAAIEQPATPMALDATPDELAKLEAAVRRDDA